MDMFLFGKYNIIWIGVPSQWWEKNINLWLWVPSELSAAKAWSGQIKQSWRGNDSTSNQICVRSPQREIDVLSDAEDFNSLCYNTDKQSAFCLENISLIVWVCFSVLVLSGLLFIVCSMCIRAWRREAFLYFSFFSCCSVSLYIFLNLIGSNGCLAEIMLNVRAKTK